jgi:hypothetical protein
MDLAPHRPPGAKRLLVMSNSVECLPGILSSFIYLADTAVKNDFLAFLLRRDREMFP